MKNMEQTDREFGTSRASIAILPEQLEEVRRRRILAFLVDYVIISLLIAVGAVVIFFIGILTLGLGWLLWAIVGPLVAIAYMALTLGGPDQRTIGMKMFSLSMINLDGKQTDPILAILHGILFWVIHIVGTPAMFVVSLFSSRKRLLHDILLGNVVVRSDV